MKVMKRAAIFSLSCQFGARGFTQEMRDAVGATQEGLTEFLSQYPSLFVVDGENIILCGFGETESKSVLAKMPSASRQRDYVAEAVEFFEAKLEVDGARDLRLLSSCNRRFRNLVPSCK